MLLGTAAAVVITSRLGAVGIEGEKQGSVAYSSLRMMGSQL